MSHDDTLTLPDATAVLADIRRHGLARGWQDVVTACSQPGQASEGALLLAFADGVERGPFERWVGEQGPAAAVASLSLAQLRERPAATLGCAGVVAVFSTALPSPDDLATAQRGLSQLPAGMRATVVVAGDNLRTEDDLKSARKMAWGLFAPEPKATWTGQSFAGTQVFLWFAAGGPADVGAERRDLAAFIRDAQPGADAAAERAYLAVGHAIGVAQARADAAAFARRMAAARSGPARRWRAEDLERQLTERLQSVTADLGRAWRVAVRAAASQIRGRAESALARDLGRARTRAALDEAVADAMRALREELAHAGGAAEAAWSEALESALDAAPWQDIAGAGGPSRASVHHALMLSAAPPESVFAWPEGWSEVGAASTGPGLARWLAAAAAAIVGVLVGGALIALLGGVAAHAPQLMAAHHAVPHFAPLRPPVVAPIPHGLHPGLAPHAGLDLGRLALGGALGGGGGAVLGYAASGLWAGKPAGPSPQDLGAGVVATWSEAAVGAADRLVDRLQAEASRDLKDRLAAMARAAPAEPVTAPADAETEADAAALRGWRDALAALAR